MKKAVVMLLIWWFAAVSPSGKATFHEYVEKKDCDMAATNYARVVKTTNCMWR